MTREEREWLESQDIDPDTALCPAVHQIGDTPKTAPAMGIRCARHFGHGPAHAGLLGDGKSVVW